MLSLPVFPLTWPKTQNLNSQVACCRSRLYGDIHGYRIWFKKKVCAPEPEVERECLGGWRVGDAEGLGSVSISFLSLRADH